MIVRMTSSDAQTFVVAFFAIGFVSAPGTVVARYAGQLYWRRRGLVWAGTDRAVLATASILGVILWAAIALIVVVATCASTQARWRRCAPGPATTCAA